MDESAESVIAELMAEQKGILFAVEQSGSEEARFTRFGITDAEGRTAFRQVLFSTPGIEEHVSGVIVSPGVLQEKTKEGVPVSELLASKKIRTGVVLDVRDGEEKILASLTASKTLGATFAAFLIDAVLPGAAVSEETDRDIQSLTAAAKLCRTAGVLPLLAVGVPPSGMHSAEKTEDALIETLSLLSDACVAAGINPSQIIVGVSMASAGTGSVVHSSPEEVAERTVRAITTALPQTLGGVLFLSDAEAPEEATANLNAIARLEPLPWPIAFCFSRALLDPVLSVWGGKEEQFAEAQAVFETRLSLLSRADAGGYGEDLEAAAL